MEYDLEWLTVLFLTNNLLNVRSSYTKLPRECVNSESDATRKDFRPTEEELESVKKKFGDDLKIPMNFVKTAPAFNPDVDSSDFHLIKLVLF